MVENLPGMGEAFQPQQVPGAGAVATRSCGDGGMWGFLMSHQSLGVQLEPEPPSTTEGMLRPVGGLQGLEFYT